MIGKIFPKIKQKLVLVFSMSKNKKYILLMFQDITQIVKKYYHFYDSKWTRMALYHSRTITHIIERNNL